MTQFFSHFPRGIIGGILINHYLYTPSKPPLFLEKGEAEKFIFQNHEASDSVILNLPKFSNYFNP